MVNRLVRVLLVMLLSMLATAWLAGAPPAWAAPAEPVGNVLSVGDPEAPAQIDLYLDPMCPYSGELIQEQGSAIGDRIESGSLRVNLHLVAFLDRYSASGDYDIRAINAAYTVAAQSRDSQVSWGFVERIFSAEHQPEENGDTDLNNEQLADLADEAGAPQFAGNLIRIGLPIGYDPAGIAADNLESLRTFPKSGVPLVAVGGQPVDIDGDWLGRLPH